MKKGKTTKDVSDLVQERIEEIEKTLHEQINNLVQKHDKEIRKMTQRKKNILVTKLFVIIVASLYLAASLIEFTFNITAWGVVTRAFFAVSFFGCLSYYIILMIGDEKI